MGRDEVMARLVDALGDGGARLVTLAGPGGSGKSRLAIEAARIAGPTNGERVAWIDLAAIGSDDQVVSELASRIGLADVPPDRLRAELAATLGAAPALVVLDDAEHVLDGVRSAVDILAAVDGVRTLVTTTTPLGWPDEAVISVDPLDLPSDDADPAQLIDCPSMRLLLDRAAAAGATIAPTPANAAVLARIVRRVDGLPLAIELAGAMLRLLAPHQLLDRLDARLELDEPATGLRGPASAVAAGGDRRRSLRATMDWSHDLLAPEVQCLYRRLGVFSGTFDLGQLRSYLDRSVEHGLATPGIDPDDGVAALVSASLLRVRPANDGGESRYGLLGLVRDDAARRLAESGEATAANWAHANDLLSMAESRHAQLMKQPQPDALADFDAARDDLLAVLDRARQDGNAPFVVRLSGALAEYWRVRGRITEGRLWLDAALRMRPAEETTYRARALHGAGVLASLQSDFDRARARLDEAFRMRIRLGKQAEAAGTLNQVGLIALERGELEEGERICREALEMRREVGDEAAIAGSLNSLGGVLQFSGNHAEARAMFEESLAIRRRLGTRPEPPWCSETWALPRATRANWTRRFGCSMSRSRRASGSATASGWRSSTTTTRWCCSTRATSRRLERSSRGPLQPPGSSVTGSSCRMRCRISASSPRRQATSTWRVSYRQRRSPMPRGSGRSRSSRSPSTASRRSSQHAATRSPPRSWAAAETIRRTSRAALLAADRRRIDRAIAAARGGVDDDAWWSAWAAGEALSFDDSIERALAATGQRASTEPASAAV